MLDNIVPKLMLYRAEQQGLRWAVLAPVRTVRPWWPGVDLQPVQSFGCEREAVAAFRELDARLHAEGQRARGIVVSETAQMARGSVLARL